MKILLFLLVLAFGFVGCSKTDEASNNAVAQETNRDSDAALAEAWADMHDTEESEEEDPELGQLMIDLDQAPFDGRSYCNVQIIRMPSEGIANVIVQWSPEPENYEQWNSGSVDAQGSLDEAKMFTMMSVTYEPISRLNQEGDSSTTWIYNFMQPSGDFEMWVEGEAFDIAESDTRVTKGASQAPNLWPTKIVLNANLLGTEGEQKQTAAQATFTYNGLCTVNVQTFIEPAN